MVGIREGGNESPGSLKAIFVQISFRFYDSFYFAFKITTSWRLRDKLTSVLMNKISGAANGVTVLHALMPFRSVWLRRLIGIVVRSNKCRSSEHC
ncbi:hypothetical protein ANN_07802 [Periplaneta americana]|uniref:Uncharacterized protein n=1 Tax=Periplaneta americana TaxID=6978 RepID=A0ABQ8SZL6_PERAM|nr:hypothetical protein ANN_07802 [Periplaneta americana]